MNRSPLPLLLSIAATIVGPGTLPVSADPPERDPPALGNDNPPPVVHFALPTKEALPADVVEVSVEVRGSAAVTVIAVSIELDPGLLRLVDVRLSDEVLSHLESFPAAESELTWVSSDAEGWVQASLVVDFQGLEESALPPGRRPLLVFRFRVAEDATPGAAALTLPRVGSAHFESRFESSTGPVYNAARPAGRAFSSRDKFEDRLDPSLQDGAIVILPLIGDVGIFLRGDANADRTLDVSDSVQLVSHLFLGSGQDPPCEDAADANDDGALDISDPITILSFLFAGVEAEPLISRVPAPDATADALTCQRY